MATRKPDAGSIKPVVLELTGDWSVGVSLKIAGRKPLRAEFKVRGPDLVEVEAERHDRLPDFNPNCGGWGRGLRPLGVRAEECTAKDALDPARLEVRIGTGAAATAAVAGTDYRADLEWGTLGRIPGSRIGATQSVTISYRYAKQRIDSIVLTAAGSLRLRQGEPHVATPLPPILDAGETHLANIFISGRLAKLGPDNLFPILENAYPEPTKPTPTVAEQFLPKALARLKAGEPLRILAWGDSVTEASYLPDADRSRWQAQFVERLRRRFPGAMIELVTEAWGGRNTASYLAEPPGSVHNYREKVLGAKPDLIVSEFVNDAGLSPQQVEERYNRLLGDFQGIGAEWIILTPHYVRPDWMGLTRQRDIDEDPRPYVHGLRAFAAKHGVALADAALRWGRLWRQGLPYNTLHGNTINHPDARGMKLFADSLVALFP